MSQDEFKPSPEGTPSPKMQEEDRFSAFDQPTRPDEVKRKKSTRLHPRTRNLLLALVAAVVLAGLLLLVTLLPQQTAVSSVDSGSTAETVTHTLYDKTGSAERNPVASVTIANATGEYNIRYDNQSAGYVLTNYEDLPLSQNVDSLVEASTVLNASSKILNVTDMADYGLDKPDSTVTLRYTDGTANTLLLGNKTPSETGYYVRLADSQEVYVITAETANHFFAANWWYVSTTLVSPPSVREDDNNGSALLRKLTLTGKNHPQELSLRRVSSDDITELQYFKYVTTKPFLRGVSDSVGDALFAVSGIYAERAAILHPTAAQLEKYGFNDPYTVAKIQMGVESVSETTNSTTGEEENVSIVYNNTDYTITVGCMDTDENYLVMVDGINAIYIVKQDSLKEIVERQHENTTSSQLFLKNITDVSHVEVTLEGKKYDFRLSHHPGETENAKKLTVRVDEKVYDTEDFRDLYTLMVDIHRYQLLDKAPTGTPNLKLAVYDLEDKLHFSAAFYDGTGSLSDCRTSDGEIFSVRESDIAKLITQLNNYLSGERVPNT